MFHKAEGPDAVVCAGKEESVRVGNENLVVGLNAWGCDTAGALERMSGDAAFYAELAHEFIGDELFSTLGRAVEDGDIKGAFMAAHSLKGVTGNLGLTPCMGASVK